MGRKGGEGEREREGGMEREKGRGEREREGRQLEHYMAIITSLTSSAFCFCSVRCFSSTLYSLHLCRYRNQHQ